MGDVWSELGKDHVEVQQLLLAMKGDPVDGPPPKKRKSLADQIVKAVSKHEVVEEICFWPVVERHLGDSELVHEALFQEGVGKQLLHELGRTRPGTVEFSTLARQADSQLRQHILFEEARVWPALMRRVSEDEADRLGAEIVSLRAGAPTRPHPLVPPDPKLLATTGPFVGALDRARDLVARRG